MKAHSSMTWWRLELEFGFELEETLVWKLEELGIKRVAIQFDPKKQALRTLLVWLPADECTEVDRSSFMQSLYPLAKTFGLSFQNPNWKEVEDQDWSLSWKEHWKPDPVGNSLLILPAWLEVPDIHSHRRVLRLDPGCAFGTGSHATTRLCLEAIERHPPLGLRIADLGCGSGVLGLAALAFGAEEVSAVDTDSLAVHSTASNAILNGFEDSRIRVSTGSVGELESLLNGDGADLLLCNILASVIEELAPKFTRLVTRNGRALLSGLLVEQASTLASILEGLGWEPITFADKEGWGLLEIRKN